MSRRRFFAAGTDRIITHEYLNSMTTSCLSVLLFNNVSIYLICTYTLYSDIIIIIIVFVIHTSSTTVAIIFTFSMLYACVYLLQSILAGTFSYILAQLYIKKKEVRLVIPYARQLFLSNALKDQH